MPSPESDPRPDQVFADIQGSLCSRCIRCGDWTPLRDQSPDTRVRIGRIIRVPNKNFGVPHHPRQFDEYLWCPQVRVGPGCPRCQREYERTRRANPTAREPFIKVAEFPTHVTASPVPTSPRRPVWKVR